MKHFLSAILAALVMSGQAATETVDGIEWTYQIVCGTASVGGGVSGMSAVPTSTKGEVSVPSTLGGMPVTRIGNYAFEKCYSIRKVTVPENVIEIGNYAFSKCWSLTSLEILGSVRRMGVGAFESAGLTSFEIPNGITEIESNAFSGTKLKSISIPHGVRRIGGHAFYNCYDLSTITIPSSVECIEHNAFRNCTSLGEGLIVVDGCVLTYNGDCPEAIILPAGTRLVAGGVFNECRSLVDVSMPEGLISIGDCAFLNCSAITNLTFPNSLKQIGASAFFGCDALESVTMHNGVETMGDSTFCSCTALTSITISDRMKSISANAFNGCRSLREIDIPEGVGDIGCNAFYICTKLESISIPDSVTNIAHDAFSGCSGLGDGVVIVNGCVITANELQGVVELSEGVRLIATGALSGWLKVEGFRVEAANQFFSEVDGALYNKEKTRLICCPGGVCTLKVCNGATELGEYACYNCRNLTEVLLPQSLQRIGDDAFEFCYGLKEMELPAHVQSIGKNVFALCGSLSTMKVYPIAPPSLGKGALVGASSLKSISVQSVSLVTYKSAEGWSDYAGMLIGMKEPGSAENPWRIGDGISAYIDDGCLYINGNGNVGEAPWLSRALEITNVDIAPAVTGLHSGVLSGMANLKTINGLSTQVFNSLMGGITANLSITGIDAETQAIVLSVKVLKTESLQDVKWEQSLDSIEVRIPVDTPAGFFKLENSWIGR